MARIRIVDEWLRSPTAVLTRRRAVMVVADGWAEQRVLMRAFAGCNDQTEPTISLHGKEVPIGPAGGDPYGPWGIHADPPRDGWAQSLREQLELAAKRLAGSKGNPPRLRDEPSRFEAKPTNVWAPGTPRDRQTPAAPYGRPSDTVPEARPLFDTPAGWASPVQTSLNVGRRRRRTSARPPRAGAQNLATVVGKTLPVGFQLSDEERNVLNALGTKDLEPGDLAELVSGGDPEAWMDGFQEKLQSHGLDLFACETGPDGRRTYALRR